MPGFFSQQLTERSHFFVDWTRVGELFFSKKVHHYTPAELSQRGFILLMTAYGGYLGQQMAQEKAGLIPACYTFGGLLGGFVLSHAVVITPLLHKRYQMSQKCRAEEAVISEQLFYLQENFLNHSKVRALIEAIRLAVANTLNVSLSDDGHARASQTWGRRQALMTKIALKVTEDVLLLKTNFKTATLQKTLAFWQQDFDALQHALSEHPPEEDNRTRGSLLS